VTLVGEAEGEGDLGDGQFRIGELSFGVLDAKLPDIGADRNAVFGAEDPREVRGLHADLPGQLPKAEAVTEPDVEEVAGEPQPAREATLPVAVPNRGAEDLVCEPCDHQMGQVVRMRDLTRHPSRKRVNLDVREVVDPVQEGANALRQVEAVQVELQRERSCPFPPEAIAVPLSGRLGEHGCGGAFQGSRGKPHREVALEDDGEDGSVVGVKRECGKPREAKIAHPQSVELNASDLGPSETDGNVPTLHGVPRWKRPDSGILAAHLHDASLGPDGETSSTH